MAGSGPAVEILERLAAQASEGLRRFGQTYVGVLFNPSRDIPGAAAGSHWSFPLAMIFGHSVLSALLLSVAWRVIAPALGRSGVGLKAPLVCLALIVFLTSLSLAAVAGVRVLARQRSGLLVAMNCVAVALVPLSALTVCAWVVLYLSFVLSLLVFVFGLLVALCFFAEALRNQCDLPTGSGLYAVPLMVVVALLATGVFLFVLASMKK